jgi:hypothetical protein
MKFATRVQLVDSSLLHSKAFLPYIKKSTNDIGYQQSKIPSLGHDIVEDEQLEAIRTQSLLDSLISPCKYSTLNLLPSIRTIPTESQHSPRIEAQLVPIGHHFRSKSQRRNEKDLSELRIGPLKTRDKKLNPSYAPERDQHVQRENSILDRSTVRYYSAKIKKYNV